MKKFMDEDFLLSTDTAKQLYHTFAKDMPIIDYHCHIDPKEIAQDRKFENLTQAWLGGDHYKWRLMRANGVEEYYITGDAPDYEKFLKWTQTLEIAIGNPLYHWSHLELKKYFGYDGYLNSDTAKEVWDLGVQKFSQNNMSVRGIIKNSNVELICTTDDPIDDLLWHKKIAEDKSFDTVVLPTFRPDKAMGIEAENYFDYIKELSKVCNTQINSFKDLIASLYERIDYFHKFGCKISDHGLYFVMYQPLNEADAEKIFKKRLNDEVLTQEEIMGFKTLFMQALAKKYHELSWTMQIHFGCKRNNNQSAFKKLGPDTGFDAINNFTSSAQLADFLNSLEEKNSLPKTILYSLNPNDDTYIDTMIGCFQDSSAKSKIQHGSAWWFNDHKSGMINQMTSLANVGLLSNFVGMLTDSRSFLSYTRHEYFRRILCELVGTWVENGEYPKDNKTLEKIIKGISYNNAKKYFQF